MRGLITAVRTLTIIPLPGRDSENFSSSLVYFPLVGWLLGMIVMWAGMLAGKWQAWPAGQAVVCVALSAFLTRGLHLDGLADVFDSLGAHTRERRLEIMKDPHIGTFGVVALVVIMLAKFAAYERLMTGCGMLLVPVAFVVSRYVQVALAVCLPYARDTGGTAEHFVKGATAVHLLVASLLGAIACFIAGMMEGVLYLAGGLILAGILARWMKSMFGGVTGDLLGMSSEVTETATLLTMAFLAKT